MGGMEELEEGGVGRGGVAGGQSCEWKWSWVEVGKAWCWVEAGGSGWRLEVEVDGWGRRWLQVAQNGLSWVVAWRKWVEWIEMGVSWWCRVVVGDQSEDGEGDGWS